MPVTADLASAPLAETVHRLHALDPEINAIHLGMDAGEARGWVLCRDLIADPAAVRRWADEYAAFLVTRYPDASPGDLRSTAAACVLDSYAYASGFLVGSLFHIARRVPCVDVDVVAIRIHPVERWITGVALLDPQFWCRPDDPAAADPSATVVPDDIALAKVARDQVHTHASTFLASYNPGVGIGRLARIGAFFDALDSAPWIVSEHIPPVTGSLNTSAVLLPGGTPIFPTASRLHTLVDGQGRTHVTRRRLFCCRSHLIDDPCMDCPRVTDVRRRELATNLHDSEPGSVNDGLV